MRILHVGLGPLGKRITEDFLSRQLGTLGAVVDVSPDVVGTTVGSTVVTADLEAALADGKFDAAIVATSSDLSRCAETLRTLLRAGLAVVSTCEELLWPELRHPDLAKELDQLAKQHGGRVLGTGINPGFLMDTLPVFASTVCRSVDSFESWRIQDATTRRIPFQRKIGATLDDAGFEAKKQDGSLRHVGLGESLHFAAHYLGLPIERWEESLEAVKADRDLECGLGPIPKGHATGVRQVAEGFDASGRCRVRLEFQAAIGQAKPHDRVRIEGEPNVDLRIDGGVHGDVATSAVVLNSIRPLLAAPPGLHTMATIPLVSFAPAR